MDRAQVLSTLEAIGKGSLQSFRSVRRLLAQHRFTNRARIAVYQVAREHGVPKVDTLLLVFETAKGKWLGTHMRADEAVLVIEKLARGLYRSVRGWKVEKMKRRKGRA